MLGSLRELRTLESALLFALAALPLAACSDSRDNGEGPGAGSSNGGAEALPSGATSGSGAGSAGGNQLGGSGQGPGGGNSSAAGGGATTAGATMGSAGTTVSIAGASGSGGATASSGCTTAEGMPSGKASIQVAGAAREYILKVPGDYDASRAYKLIFAFHARGGNAAQVAGSGNDDYYGLASRAKGEAIFVSPEGLDAGWRNTDGRDIAFVKAMIDELGSKLCVDQRRIFATGFSFGGMMSDAIGCAMADVFRAIAPMAGGLPNDEHPYSGCDQVNMHPIAVWMAHGAADTTVPIADGKAALDLFVARSQCQAQTAPVMPEPCVAYQGCMAEYPIHFCEFSGGHTVPGFAPEAIWSFFAGF